jgi:hypothetical protein
VIYLGPKGSGLVAKAEGVGKVADLNSNFSQNLNSVREIILEIENCHLKVCYQILDDLQRNL